VTAELSNRISIAYLIDNLGHGGGTENQLHTLVTHLDTSKFDPIIIALGRRFPDYNLSAPCEVIHLNWSRLLHWSSLSPFARLIRILRKRQVRILQLFFPDSRFIGLLAGLCARVPHIVVSRRDCHAHPGVRRRLIYLITSKLSGYCLVNSQAAKAIVLRQEQFAPERVTVIPNSIAVINQRLVKSTASKHTSDLVIGIVANLRPVKRIDRFLRLAHRLSAEVDRFHIVGFGWPSDRQKYMNYAADLGIAHMVEFQHSLTDIADLLRAFSIGVLTSDAEGLSNALIEYAMCGLPAVAFDVGGNREVIQHGRTGWLAPPGREDIMCYYIRLLIHWPELRHRMGHRAREHALSAFSIARMVNQTESFYYQILQQ